MSGLFERVTGLELRSPAYLLVGAAAVLLALLLRRRAPALRFAPAALLPGGGVGGPPLPRSWRAALLPLPGVLFLGGVVLGAVALARPTRREAVPIETKGIDLLLCLDTSSSMTERMAPGGGAAAAAGGRRLDVAKDAAAAFVRSRPNDRIGLVTFARYADLRCPPTLDHHALLSILADVEPVAGDAPEDATGIGTAVARAADVLREGRPRSRVAVLLTDGEETVATPEATGEIAPAHAGQLAQALGVRVYAIVAGSGAEGGPSAAEGPVGRMARRTGGDAFSARDADAVSAVYARIDALERGTIEEPRWRLEDRHLPFLFLAAALVVLGALLASGPLGTLP